jgi:hypothetical protein
VYAAIWFLSLGQAGGNPWRFEMRQAKQKSVMPANAGIQVYA